jgi:hypothetical protein
VPIRLDNSAVRIVLWEASSASARGSAMAVTHTSSIEWCGG